jgi:hypothetical protein
MRGYRFLRIVLAAVFGVLRRLSWRAHFALHRLLRLDEFDVRDLRSGRRRNQEEEHQHEQGQHDREVRNVRATGRFRQLDNHVRIYLAALERGVVVGIAARISDEAGEECNEDQRHRAAEVRFH